MEISPMTLIDQLIGLALILAVFIALLSIPFTRMKQRWEITALRHVVAQLARQSRATGTNASLSSKPAA